MQSLLRWSIENSSNNVASPPTRRTDLDPGIIDAILGRPDSELMKEALAKAQDVSLDEDVRVTALDDLEMVNLHFLTPHCCVGVVSLLLFSRLTNFTLDPSSYFPTSSSRTLIMRMVIHACQGVYDLINRVYSRL
jgi:Nucleotide exchange factor Fes1